MTRSGAPVLRLVEVARTLGQEPTNPRATMHPLGRDGQRDVAPPAPAGVKKAPMDRPDARCDALVPGHLLLVDADGQRAAILAQALRKFGYSPEILATLPQASDRLSGSSAAILDYASLAGRAACVVRTLREVGPDSRIIVLSHIASLPGAVACIKAGAAEFLTHPASAEEIDTIIRAGHEPTPRPRVTSLAEATRLHAQAILRSVDDDTRAAARLLRVRPLTLRRLLGLP